MSAYTGLTRQAENNLRVLNFDHPAWVPAQVGFLPIALTQFGEALDDLRLAHPRLFPSFTKPAPPLALPPTYQAGRVRDNWGCGWESLHEGMVGQVVDHPLADWAALATWTPPDPERDAHIGPFDWAAIARHIEGRKARGEFMPDAVLQHGFHFLLMSDLRGYANLMLDMITDEPRLHELLKMIIHYNSTATRKLLDAGCEYMLLAEDLGMQTGLPVSPELWRKWVKPGYEATAGQARDRQVPVFLHCDGHILPIVDDLIETGVRVLNPQVRANGLPGIRAHMKGKLVIHLDLDRQLFPFATPDQLRQHVRDAYDTLYDPAGGLMFSVEIGQDVPLASMDVLFTAIEEICNLPDPDPATLPSVGLW